MTPGQITQQAADTRDWHSIPQAEREMWEIIAVNRSRQVGDVKRSATTDTPPTDPLIRAYCTGFCHALIVCVVGCGLGKLTLWLLG